jgi:hypothetical protein
MQERNQGDQPNKPEPYQENPTSWEGGERFQVILHEETTNEGKQELSLQVFDGKEIVLIQFRESVRSSRTLFLPAEQTTPLPPEQVQRATALPLPETTASTPTAKEVDNRPLKLVGTVTSVGQLGETKKQKRAMLQFTLMDEINNVERRAVAFDTIAQRLADPQTHLQPQEPITLFAWKHENRVHIDGKERTVEDWYVQKAIYHGTVYEKPRSPNKRRDTRR